jgi:uncharacterized membrane protein YdjX (TVP38/TMEM64 family)
MKSLWWRLSLGLLIILVIISIHAFGFFDWLTLAYVQKIVYEVRLWTTDHFIAGPVLYMALILVSTAFFSTITVVATIVSGYLFGALVGLCYTVAAVTLSSCAMALLVRYGFGHSVQEKIEQYANGFTHELDRYGAYYVLMINLLPMTPTVLINILVGLSTMPIWSFAWATALGIVPDSLIYVLVGEELLTLKSLNDLFSWKTVGVFVLLIFLVLASMIISRWVRSKKVAIPGIPLDD